MAAPYLPDPLSTGSYMLAPANTTTEKTSTKQYGFNHLSLLLLVIFCIVLHHLFHGMVRWREQRMNKKERHRQRHSRYLVDEFEWWTLAVTCFAALTHFSSLKSQIFCNFIFSSPDRNKRTTKNEQFLPFADFFIVPPRKHCYIAPSHFFMLFQEYHLVCSRRNTLLPQEKWTTFESTWKGKGSTNKNETQWMHQRNRLGLFSQRYNR